MACHSFRSSTRRIIPVVQLRESRRDHQARKTLAMLPSAASPARHISVTGLPQRHSALTVAEVAYVRSARRAGCGRLTVDWLALIAPAFDRLDGADRPE